MKSGKAITAAASCLKIPLVVVGLIIVLIIGAVTLTQGSTEGLDGAVEEEEEPVSEGFLDRPITKWNNTEIMALVGLILLVDIGWGLLLRLVFGKDPIIAYLKKRVDDMTEARNKRIDDILDGTKKRK